MSWKVKDEYLDLAQARHVVVFHNQDTGAEHHLLHEFSLPACPHCGVVQAQPGQLLDFEKVKADTLAKLHAHHRAVMNYREKHLRVRLGSAPLP